MNIFCASLEFGFNFFVTRAEGRKNSRDRGGDRHRLYTVLYASHSIHFFLDFCLFLLLRSPAPEEAREI